MATTIISNPGRVLAYINQYLPLAASGGMKGLGLERDGELVGGVIYEGHNGHNVFMHIAFDNPHWMTRRCMWYAFHYPFNEMGVKRVTGWVEAHNTASRRFQERLGFTQEAVLSGAASDGGDVIIYKMLRQDCRYIEREVSNG